MYATQLGNRRVLLAAVVALGTALCPAWAAPGVDLERGFAHPPDTAKPHTWWHWMNGNISKEGITHDLEAMKQVGLGGAQIFDVAVGFPSGPVKHGSAEWRAMVEHALREADRLGLEICLHNCAGWSSSGGPWVTREQAMQMVVTSERRVAGPARFDAVLPQPPTRLGFYRDIAVLAFRTPPADGPDNPTPEVTAGPLGSGGPWPRTEALKLVDGDIGTQASALLAGRGQPGYLQFEYPRAMAIRSLAIAPAGGAAGEPCELQVSEDGTTFRKVADFAIPEPRLTGAPGVVTFDAATGRFFRLSFARARTRATRISLAEVSLLPGFRISQWPEKAGYLRANPGPDTRPVTPDLTIPRLGAMDLTDRMTPEGLLQWEVPEGDWTILRLGHTPTGMDNHPAPEEGRGLEVDKLSKEAVEAHFDALMGKVIADAGPLAGKSLKHILIDSYEVDCQNWTPRFREEFRRLRGYDPLPYYPALTGRVVDTLDASERFLWDWRRTIADLFAESYYGHFATLCHRHGIELSVEPYGNGNFDDLTVGGRGDIPMGEFWSGWGNDNQCSKLASSVAHTYGRKYVGAEAFTADNNQGRWQNHPYSLKALGDLIYCGGINRFIFHRYAHQPWDDLLPGMTMGPWGFHFERTLTWWKQAPAWTEYLTRCQYLLQEGRFVADLLYLYGEGAPNSPPGRQGLRPAPPAGHDYDVCSAEVALTRLSVEDGRLALPDGMSYRVLVLPEGEMMTPALLRKVRDLVQAGAVVVGPKPLRSPSLQDGPEADRQVQALAGEVWAACDGKAVTEHAFGKGRVVWGKPLAEVLAALGLAADFEAASARRGASFQYIHRTVDGAEVYLVSNQGRRSEVVECTFRVAGKAPELWHPDTGATEAAPVWWAKDGRTTVPLRLDAAGSVFVVFRQPATAGQLVAVEHEGQSVLHERPRPAGKLEIRKATYGVLSAALVDAVDVTQQLARLVQNGALTVQASNALAGDPAQNVVKQLFAAYTLNGQRLTKTVEENETLRLPEGEPKPGDVLEIRRALYGVLPANPEAPPETRTVDLTEKLAGLVQNGALSVAATNELAGGDPAPLVVKQLQVAYTLDGKPYSKTINERDTLDLPDGTEDGPAGSDLPAATVALAGGKPVLTAWEPGEYALKTASGKTLRTKVARVPAPVELKGAWEVRFPPKWGAPEQVSFPSLISWPEHENPGIRYFSGTATYWKELTIPRELLRPGRVLLIDLGVVREIAEVRLNGMDLGILWKPPFQVDVTRAARPGVNTLEVRVTNLWPNRLIGDEQLPEDCEFQPGGPIQRWPEWLVEGKPRPASGRFTFTTWQHYTKDSPLLPSGLLGPVTLRCGQQVTFPKAGR